LNHTFLITYQRERERERETERIKRKRDVEPEIGVLEKVFVQFQEGSGREIAHNVGSRNAVLQRESEVGRGAVSEDRVVHGGGEEFEGGVGVLEDAEGRVVFGERDNARSNVEDADLCWYVRQRMAHTHTQREKGEREKERERRTGLDPFMMTRNSSVWRSPKKCATITSENSTEIFR
jgi:hypothetical protein